MSDNLEVGSHAPSFTMQASGQREVSDLKLKGQPYLLYFYPKADTPGCTTQACGIQEALPQLGKLKLEVIGVSPDPVPKVDKFAAKFNLTFPLASDHDHSVADKFGTWVEKSMYGKKYMGVERSSFLVDGEGIIRAIWRKVKPAEHAADVMKAAQAL